MLSDEPASAIVFESDAPGGISIFDLAIRAIRADESADESPAFDITAGKGVNDDSIEISSDESTDIYVPGDLSGGKRVINDSSLVYADESTRRIRALNRSR